MISLRNISYSCRLPGGRHDVLRAINLDIIRGEYVAIMGPNGSGKSTLAKILSGLLADFNGEYSIDGDSVSGHYNLALEKAGYVFQNPDNQIVSMTVESELAFPMENRGIRHCEMVEKISVITELLGLDKLLNRDPNTLSGGEKQKLVIASMLTASPEILILDEPTSLLDPSDRIMILELINKIQGGDSIYGEEIKPAIIHITQFPEEAQKARRLVVMDEGVIVKDGDPEDVFTELYETGELVIPLPSMMLNQLKGNEVLSIPVEYLDGNQTEKTSAGEAYNLSGVNYGYKLPWGKKIDALSDVSANIYRGNITGIMGLSGSGKTSLALLMAFLEKPDSGKIVFFGEDLTDDKLTAFRRRAGLSFQFPERQFFCETVEKELSFGPGLRNTDDEEIKRAVTDALLSVGMKPEELLRRDPFTLSGGEMRKVALAVTLALDPDVLILDEPTSGLDGAGMEYLKSMCERLRDSGKTIIIISHNTEFILSVCDYTAFMENGEIKTTATVGDILAGRCGPEQYGIPLTAYASYVIEKCKAGNIPLKKLPPPGMTQFRA
ncbi:MAG: ATP-binding cassette domain-containing protein [candidate division Zixibacteria bacterium]|nr:ATP-binding cassette domain-containing protein [candidate division Zixibacteria bacterium]